MDLPRFVPVPFALARQKRSTSLRWRVKVPHVGLQFKLVVLVIGVSLIGVFTSSFLILTLQRQQLLETTEAALTRSSIAIAASLEHAMLRNDRAMVSEIAQRMVNRQSVERVRVLDMNGQVRISSASSEVGERVPLTEPICQSCHTSGTPSRSRTTVVQSEDGLPVLLNATLIRNSSECQSCHDASTGVLGIMMIETPLTDLDDQLTASFWRIGLAAVLTMGLLAGLTVVALRRLVIHPVDELIQGMTEIRRGHLDYVVHASSRDELGDLAEAFDTMRKELKSLVQQARHLATLKERDRLAREMHDNLAQELGYIKTRLWLTDAALIADQVAEARSNLADLRQITDEAYTDVREIIFCLRSAVLPIGGFVPTLREYLAEYQTQYGIETQLVCDDKSLLEFPAEAELQVCRIIQEAMTNIRKHSGVRKAWIRFQREDGRIRISIEDHGRGFDPASLVGTRLRHYGLDIMRERVESVGGNIEIHSQASAGTRIVLRVPIMSTARGSL